jgi:prolyl oligopeptidase
LLLLGRLEDPDSEEARAWVEEQNKLTFGLLEECDYRGKIHDRLKEVYNYPKYSCPFKRGDRFYFFKNDGLQNQSVLYTQETLDAEPTVPLSFFFPQACTLRDADGRRGGV